MEIKNFCAWIIMFISLSAGIMIANLWYRVTYIDRKKYLSEPENRNINKGLLFLSIALFIWGISSMIQKATDNENSKEVFKTIFSTLNSLFLILE